MSRRFCFALDLKDDPDLVAAYERHHHQVWPEILQSIRDAGIEQMEIWRTGNRLFMTMRTTDDFSFEARAAADQASPRVQEWETLMWTFQQPLPFAAAGEKWVRMERIFALDEIAAP
jgi:L-rhamnose mutarotase